MTLCSLSSDFVLDAKPYSSHDLILAAIRRAITYCTHHNTLTIQTAGELRVHETEEDADQKADATDTDTNTPKDQLTILKDALLAKFGSAEAAFKHFNKEGVVAKKEWKRIVKKTLVNVPMTGGDMKALRKALPKKSNLADFCAFIGGPSQTSKAEIGNTEKTNLSKERKASSKQLADLPPEVPELPSS